MPEDLAEVCEASCAFLGMGLVGLGRDGVFTSTLDAIGSPAGKAGIAEIAENSPAPVTPPFRCGSAVICSEVQRWARKALSRGSQGFPVLRAM